MQRSSGRATGRVLPEDHDLRSAAYDPSADNMWETGEAWSKSQTVPGIPNSQKQQETLLWCQNGEQDEQDSSLAMN